MEFSTRNTDLVYNCSLERCTNKYQ